MYEGNRVSVNCKSNSNKFFYELLNYLFIGVSGFVIIKTFTIRFFMGTPNGSLQLFVHSFMLRGFQILVGCSLFNAAMLFFIKVKCITFIAKKQEKYLFICQFKNLTRHS